MKIKLLIFYFLISLSIKLMIIALTPSLNNFIDLNIYRDAGQLIVNKVNPYNFKDNIKLREHLRTDKINYNFYVSKSQKSWDYYSSSNLPLANYLFGIIEYCFKSNLSYRIVFAFGDCILALIVLFLIIKRSGFEAPNKILINTFIPNYYILNPYFVAFILTAFSPIMILWGTIFTGHKGIGLMLIILTIYLSSSSRKIFWLYLTPIFLSFSVTFIGLGLFLAPYCIYNTIKKATSMKNIFTFLILGLFSTFLVLYNYFPEVFSMMSLRSRPLDRPEHASMWVWVYNLWPNSWSSIKYIFIIFFIIINILTVIKHKLDFTLLSISLMLLFVVIYLDSGSMDRINIAITSSIILIGMASFNRFFFFLSILYFIYGTIILGVSIACGIHEILDSIFCTIFILMYSLFLLGITFNFKIKHFNYMLNKA